MTHSFFRKSTFILIGLFMLSLVAVKAQNKVYKAEDIVKDKLEVIQATLNLSDDQVVKIKAIDKETENKLEEAPDNSAAKKVYQWRDNEYKKVLTAEQFKKYLKEKQAIVDEAQATWMQSHGTVVEGK
ncbi:hypothetical protein LJB92_01220 [Bacteroidales bacterium OttesenSCG-928-M06]|nr:hypothetical protein [Bacteroidales bacterium OttesenSCG-928-M06]